MFLLYRHTKRRMTTFLTIFRRYPTTLGRFPKIFQSCSEGETNVVETFWRLLKTCKKLEDASSIIHAPTNLSTIWETNLISVKSSISSLVHVTCEYGKYTTRVPDVVFLWILRVVYFSVKHSCLRVERLNASAFEKWYELISVVFISHVLVDVLR